MRSWNLNLFHMLSKLFKSLACLLGVLLLSGVDLLAQKGAEGEKKVHCGAIVYARDLNDKRESSAFSFPAIDGAQIRLTLSDGQIFSLISSSDNFVVFRNLPAGSEYLAEVFAAGFSSPIYHGRVLDDPRSRLEFYIVTSTDSAEEPSFFEDPGPADVEGFVVCPSEYLPFATEPLPEAVVLYTSSADLLYTTTDQHGYFRFDGVKDKEGKVSISYPNYKTAEVTVPLEDDSRWVWVKMEKDL